MKRCYCGCPLHGEGGHDQDPDSDGRSTCEAHGLHVYIDEGYGK